MHGVFEERVGRLTCTFDRVHRGVGVAQQRIDVVFVDPRDGDPDACAGEDLAALHGMRLVQDRDDAVRDRLDLGLAAGAVEQDGEFISSDPSG
jgi:hypothetical protein